LVGSDERDGSDLGVLADVVDGVDTSVYHVNNTIWKFGVVQQLGKNVAGTSNLLRRLHDVGVAQSNGDWEHPEGNHDWEVKGSNTGTDSKGNSETVEIDVSGDIMGGFSHLKAGEAEAVLNDLEASCNITSGIWEGFTLFFGDALGELLGVILEAAKVVENESLTDEDGCFAPFLEGIAG
jgi:hypothetical protein